MATRPCFSSAARICMKPSLSPTLTMPEGSKKPSGSVTPTCLAGSKGGGAGGGLGLLPASTGAASDTLLSLLAFRGTRTAPNLHAMMVAAALALARTRAAASTPGPVDALPSGRAPTRGRELSDGKEACPECVLKPVPGTKSCPCPPHAYAAQPVTAPRAAPVTTAIGRRDMSCGMMPVDSQGSNGNNKGL